MKKKLVLVIIFGLIMWVVRSLFISEIRFKKEEFLIERNYKRNIEAFKSINEKFQDFPDISLNFNKDNHLEIIVSNISNSYWNDLYQEDSAIVLYKIPDLFITDTSIILLKEEYQYLISDFVMENNMLLVKASNDSIINLINWTVNYSGNQTRGQMDKIFEIANLDLSKIELIKQSLREINCFGYEKSPNGNLILNFRSNPYFMIDVFSYVILTGAQKAKDEFENMDLYGEKLGKDVYWVHYEKYLVSYVPYLKLRNRKI